ncbi:MAG: PGDYG domain-containing protein [Bacteroidales bacterium]|nr:PGDYG domain-containing protein [Bacteroidales bacterium]
MIKNNDPGNKRLLYEVNLSGKWKHYKKTKPMWAKKLDQPETVETLEGPITYQEGDYLCKGHSKDIWGQKAESLIKKYDPVPDSKPDLEGWEQYTPKPDTKGVMAASIDFDFSIEHPSWGTFNGNAGDYLVKNFEDKDIEYPEDIWIVKKEIFESTYKIVNP